WAAAEHLHVLVVVRHGAKVRGELLREGLRLREAVVVAALRRGFDGSRRALADGGRDIAASERRRGARNGRAARGSIERRRWAGWWLSVGGAAGDCGKREPKDTDGPTGCYRRHGSPRNDGAVSIVVRVRIRRRLPAR